MHRFALAITLALAAATAAVAQTPPSAEAFGRMPAMQFASVSPDGKRVAFIGGTPDRRVLSVSVIDGGKVSSVDLGPVRALSVRWAGADNILAEIVVQSKLGTLDSFSFERTLVLDPEARQKGHLLSNSAASNYLTALPILDVNPGPPPFVMVEGLDWNDNMTADNITHFKRNDQDLVYALWKVDVASGRGTVIDRGNEKTRDWAVDLAGEPQGRLDSIDDQRSIILARDGRGWRQVAQGLVTLEGYSDQDGSLYWSQVDGAGATRITRMNLASGEQSVVNPDRGAWGLKWDHIINAPVGLYGDPDLPPTWLDPQIGQVHTLLSHAFKGRTVELVNWSRDRTKFVVRVNGADVPAHWYLFDTVRKEASDLGAEYPELGEEPLGTTQFIHYAAADGTQIPAYVRLPVGRAPKGLPLVVMPHGGPAARDYAEFDWWVSFLTSRGYAVLQPQFRGSEGFGHAFETAGDGEWGGKMQSDVYDGVRYLIQQGIVDPSRVCIVGASYGGFAALQGAAQFPQTYRCAVSVNGVSDPGSLLTEEQERYGQDSDVQAYLRRIVGINGSAPLPAPVREARAIRAPVLLIYSENDTTVPPIQSQMMAKALNDVGNPATMVTLPGDDHQLRASASRVKMLQSLDTFLAAHLGARP